MPQVEELQHYMEQRGIARDSTSMHEAKNELVVLEECYRAMEPRLRQLHRHVERRAAQSGHTPIIDKEVTRTAIHAAICKMADTLLDRSEERLSAQLEAIHQELDIGSAALQEVGLHEEANNLHTSLAPLEQCIHHKAFGHFWSEVGGSFQAVVERVAKALPPGPSLTKAMRSLDRLRGILEVGAEAENLGRAVELLSEELKIEEVGGAHRSAAPIDMACTALMAKFVAAQLQSDGRKGEAAEVNEMAAIIDVLQRDAIVSSISPVRAASSSHSPTEVASPPWRALEPRKPLKEKPQDDTVEQLFKLADTNNDGVVDRAEFTKAKERGLFSSNSHQEAVNSPVVDFSALNVGLKDRYSVPSNVLAMVGAKTAQKEGDAPCVLCRGSVGGHRCHACAGVFCQACCFSGTKTYESVR